MTNNDKYLEAVRVFGSYIIDEIELAITDEMEKFTPEESVEAAAVLRAYLNDLVDGLDASKFPESGVRR